MTEAPNVLLSSWTTEWPVFAGLSQAKRRPVELPEGPGVDYLGAGFRVLGGAPGLRPNPELEVLGWEPPPWLVRLYRVHGGLGPWWPGDTGPIDRWTRHALLPWEAVTPLTRHIRFGEEDICFDPADCVRIAPDGRGGGLVLVGRADPRVHWFDGQRHHLSEPWSVERGLGWVVSGWILPER